MAVDADASYHDTAKREVVNKGRKRCGVTIQPPIGYLQKSTTNDVLLSQGGTLIRQPSFLQANGLVTVRARNTCTLDNVLMCLALQWRWRTGMSALQMVETLFPRVGAAIRGVAEARNALEASKHRYLLVDSLRLSAHLILARAGEVHLNLWDSERDVVSLVFADLLESSRVFVCNSCANEDVRCDSVLDIQVNMATRCASKYATKH